MKAAGVFPVDVARALLVIAFVFSSFGVAQAGDPRQALVERGIAQGMAGDEAAASRDFQAALKIDSCYAPAWNELGRSFAFQGDPGRAVKTIGKAIECDPRCAKCYFARGKIYHRNFPPEYQRQALADYDVALSADPNFALAYSQRCALKWELLAYLPALADCNRAIDLEPDEAIYHVNRGMVYHALRNHPRAQADFAFALRKEPGLRDYIHNTMAQYEANVQMLNDYWRAINAGAGVGKSCGGYSNPKARTACERGASLTADQMQYGTLPR